METDEAPMADNELGSELTGLMKKNEKPIFGKKTLIGIITAVSVAFVIILIIILAVSLSGSDSKKTQ